MLLLDEPLGALDLKLRQEMQSELKRIQAEVGITFLYVTHDQEEALTMSDRIAIFNHGRIVQIGTPDEIYERPVNEFVASFVGTSNILARGGKRLLLRPEKIHIAAAGSAFGEAGLHVEAGPPARDRLCRHVHALPRRPRGRRRGDGGASESGSFGEPAPRAAGRERVGGVAAGPSDGAFLNLLKRRR